MSNQNEKFLHEISDLEETTLNQALNIGLSRFEFEKIVELLSRKPNKLELGIFSAMWSEHCSYKSSRAFLKKLPKQGKHVLVGPGENAGVVDVGDGLAVAFKVESHNHPSYIEPFQGAATGVGGILRDVFTMGAKPFATMNLLRFGAASHAKTSHLLAGVVSGISSYGNSFGVANMISDVAFDACYNGNILVNAFAIGVVSHDKIFLGTAKGVGNLVFYAGAKTGCDGIHGATMASGEFSEDKESERPTVQVGDPFKEKLLLEACLECFSNDIVVGIQDMGAAGLTSSGFEMAARGQCGLELHLDKVPLREEGMMPYEIMLSESQERMLIVVKQGKENELKNIFSRWGLDAVEIGKVTNDGLVKLMWHQEVYAALPFGLLTEEAPVYERNFKEPNWYVPCKENFNWHQIGFDEMLFKLIRYPSLASQHWIFDQYDSHIGLGTLQNGHEADAALIQIPNSQKAVAMTIGCDARLCMVNPFEGTRRSLARQVLALACVGAKPLGISDCLNFGSPEDPEGMWQLISSIDGLTDAATCFNVPVISGNVSLYNQTDHKPIYPTPTIALVGLHDKPSKTTNKAFKNQGDLILYVGSFCSSMSHAELLIEGVMKPSQMQSWDLNQVEKLASMVCKQVNEGNLLAAAHVGKGGLIYTIFKMGFLGNKGAHFQLEGAEKDLACKLFSENEFGVVLSIRKEKLSMIESIFSDAFKVNVLGEVTEGEFKIDADNKCVLEMPTEKLFNCYLTSLNEVIHVDN